MSDDAERKLPFISHTTDLREIIRLFKDDIKDDWFHDPLHFGDCLDGNRIRQYFERNIEQNHGRFEPVKRVLLNIPKKGGALRYSLETCIYDRLAYHVFGIPIIECFDRFLPRRVLSHRLDIKWNRGKRRYLFLNAIDQWMKFEEYVRCDASEHTILVTDLQNYFENIRIADLRDTLLQCLRNTDCPYSKKTSLRFCIDSVCRCLEAWSYNGVNGLPQNRDVSSFLANIYMLPIDKEMIDGGHDYYRYMDDIRVICSDRHEARAALKRLISALRSIGLNINAAKTSIIEPGTDRHDAFMQGTSNDLDSINAMMSSRKKVLVTTALSAIRDRLIRLLASQEFQSREFRFCIRRISKYARCQDISKPSDFFHPITQGILDAVDHAPEVMDQVYEYLIALDTDSDALTVLEQFLLDARRSVYGWQVYLLWKLFSFKEHFTEQLLARALSMIRDDSIPEAAVAGAILYLGASGQADARRSVLDGFRNQFSSFFLQRHALIAIQELDYAEVRENAQEFILEESKEIYRTLHNQNEPCYIVPPPPVPYHELIREVSSYG